MAISISWPTGVIYVPKSDLTLVQSVPTEIYNMDLNWFRLQLKSLEDTPEGATSLKTHNHNTEVTLGGITYARVIELLDPYSLTFENGYYAVNLVGANSNVGDKVNVNNVSVRSNNSAGLITTPYIEYLSFEGGVWVDQANGYSGTIFPIGTHINPVNNLLDAKTICTYRGLNVIYVIGNIIIDSGSDFNNFVFEGQSRVNNRANVLTAEQVSGTVFRNLTITGILDGGNELTNCNISGLTYVNGYVHNCGLGGRIIMGGNRDGVFSNCITIEPTNPPIMNMGGTGQNLVMPNYSGTLNIESFSGTTNFIGIGLNSGTVVLDSSTVTSGTVQIGGVGDLVDENGDPIFSGTWNGGVTIINSLMNKENIADGVWNKQLP